MKNKTPKNIRTTKQIIKKLNKRLTICKSLSLNLSYCLSSAGKASKKLKKLKIKSIKSPISTSLSTLSPHQNSNLHNFLNSLIVKRSFLNFG